MKIHASTVARAGDDAFLEERMNAPSVYVRIVAVRPNGELELACGHVVRRRMRASSVLCEHCFPLHFARAQANGRAQWQRFKASQKKAEAGGTEGNMPRRAVDGGEGVRRGAQARDASASVSSPLTEGSTT